MLVRKYVLYFGLFHCVCTMSVHAHVHGGDEGSIITLLLITLCELEITLQKPQLMFDPNYVDKHIRNLIIMQLRHYFEQCEACATTTV